MVYCCHVKLCRADQVRQDVKTKPVQTLNLNTETIYLLADGRSTKIVQNTPEKVTKDTQRSTGNKRRTRKNVTEARH